MTLGQRIRKARKRLPGMTQPKLAALLGVTYQSVSGWERDKDRPDVDKYPQLRLALRVTFAYLHTGNGDPPDPEDPEVIMDDMATSAPLHVRSSIAKAILGLRKRS